MRCRVGGQKDQFLLWKVSDEPWKADLFLDHVGGLTLHFPFYPVLYIRIDKSISTIKSAKLLVFIFIRHVFEIDIE